MGPRANAATCCSSPPTATRRCCMATSSRSTPVPESPAPAAAAAEPAVSHAAQPWRWRLFELVSSYLPLLMMALLALGTWWLVKSTPLDDEERVATPPRHEP